MCLATMVTSCYGTTPHVPTVGAAVPPSVPAVHGGAGEGQGDCREPLQEASFPRTAMDLPTPLHTQPQQSKGLADRTTVMHLSPTPLLIMPFSFACMFSLNHVTYSDSTHSNCLLINYEFLARV